MHYYLAISKQKEPIVSVTKIFVKNRKLVFAFYTWTLGRGEFEEERYSHLIIVHESNWGIFSTQKNNNSASLKKL